MNFDESFPKRVAIARNALGLTQSGLAKMVGVVSRQIAAYEGGEAKPRANALQNLAAALGTTVHWLSHGEGEGPDISNIRRTVTLREIPVLTHEQARFETYEQMIVEASVVDYIPSPSWAGERSFALKISGDSMVSNKGVSFPEGTIVTFDADLPAQSGDFVICVVDDYLTAFFKQLIVDQGKEYLRSLNPAYPMVEPDFLYIVGVAIHAQTDLRSANGHMSNNYVNPWGEVEAWGSESKLASTEQRLSEIEKKLDLLVNSLSNQRPT